MKISIIITTFNGSRFIVELLESLLSQTHKPDEVLIFDDLSTDDTLLIVNNFLQENNIKNWKVYQNSINLGHTNNFLSGIKQCTGDIIFTLDQDDILEPKKLETMHKVMKYNPNIVALSSKISLIDEFGNSKKKPINLNLINTKRFQFFQLLKLNYSSLIVNGRLLGCSMCYRNKVLKYIDNNSSLINSYGSHDTYLNLISFSVGDVVILNESLLKYRLHSNQVTSTNLRINTKKSRTSKVYAQLKLRIKYLTHLNDIKSDKAKYIKSKLLKISMFELNRVRFIRTKNLFNLLKLILTFKFYYYYSFSFFITFVVFIGDLCNVSHSRSMKGN